MTILLEQYRAGEFLIQEALQSLSRAQVVWDGRGFGSNTVVQGGTVYSLEALGNVVVSAKSGNTGNGVVSPVEANPAPCQIGVYLVMMTGATTFTVTAPDGSILNGGSSGSPYFDGIGFVFTPGEINNVFGDTYTIDVVVGATPVVTAGGSNIGNGTIGSIETAMNAPAQTGNYIVTFSSATNFTVTAPNGDELQNGVVGTAYEDQLSFTISAGTVAFAIGDGFIFGVSLGTQYATYYSGASGAAGIVYDSCLVIAGTVQTFTAINYKAEVAKSALVFLPSVTAASQASAVAQLAALGIYAR